jgi:hypothetical protein
VTKFKDSLGKQEVEWIKRFIKVKIESNDDVKDESKEKPNTNTNKD